MQRPSEFEVQALAYTNLKQHFPIVRGEYKYKISGKRGARFDIVLLDDQENIKLIIEVKKSNRSKRTTQGDRYTELTGAPTVYIRGMVDAVNAVQIATRALQGENQ